MGSSRRIRPSKVAEIVGGVDPQLVAEQDAEALVGGEGVGSTTRPVQGQHELRPAPFAQGVIGRQHLQLRHQHLVVAQGEVGVDPQLQGDGAHLLEPGHLTEPERSLGEVDQRRSQPLCEGLLEQGHSPPGVVTLEGLAAAATSRSKRCASTASGSTQRR